MPTQPNPTATSSTFQIGTYTSLTDTFTPVFDLNDGVTCSIQWNTLRMPQPQKALVRSFNLRAPGERVTRSQYKNRHIQVTVSLRGASVPAILATCRSLIAAIESPPYRLRLALPNATQYTCATVVAVTHAIPTDAQTLLAKALPDIQIDFECLPGLLGDRVTLQNLIVNPGFEAPSGPAVPAFADAFVSANAYTVVSGTAPVAFNVMTLAAGTEVSFGSPAWGAINVWQARFQFTAGANVSRWYLHRPDANNGLRVQVFSGAGGLQIFHTVGGVDHALASANPTLIAGNWYWLQITQFPAQAANAPYLQATLFNDSGGGIGAQIATIGPAATFDGATALTGQPHIVASAGSLPIGGAFTSVHTVSLFGPGGWSFAGLNGTATGTAALGWEQVVASTYAGGPVTSYSAARLDLPPAGTVDARISTWDGTGGATPAAQYGIPTAQGHLLGFGVAYKTTTGLSATSSVQAVFKEHNSSGVEVSTTTQTILLGATATSWATYSNTYLMQNAAAAYVRVQLRVVETTAGGSAGATVWFDNAQLWDQTTTGQTSMPYCELRFPQSPAQLTVSGLLGDTPAPAFVALGTYLASWPAGGTLALLLGRRAGTHPAAQLIRYPLQPFAPTANIALDSASFGGYLTRSPAASSSTQTNMVYVWPNPGAAVGTYHLVERVQSSQSAGNLGNISARLAAFEGIATGIGNQANFFNALVAGQLAASATWTLVDHGALFVPIFPAASLGDLSQQYESCYGQWQDTTSGGSTFSFGVPWLLPVDADVLGATLINPTNGGGALTAFWLWAYCDALGQNAGSGNSFAWGFSGETTGLPIPAHSIGGPGTQTTGQPSINPSASPYLTLDPQSGATAGAAGVNQCVASLVDQTGALLPLHCELQYTPIYLYPR